MMKRNQNMKDSGVEWLDMIPRHWTMKQVRHFCCFTTGFTPPTSEEKYYKDEDHDWVNISDLNKKVITETGKKISQVAIDELKPALTVKGSLMYSFKLSVGKVAFAGKDLYTNEAIFSVLPSNIYEVKYLFYSFPDQIIHNSRENIYGAKLLNQSLIKEAKITFPPKHEQTQIVAFLDEKTAKIDALIEKKKSKIQLLKEQRKALINQAVTKGLDPIVSMKDSGIERDGEVPETWGLKKLKYLYDYQKGYAFKSKIFEEKGRKVVKASDLKNLTITGCSTFISECESVKYLDYSLNENDFVLSTVGSKYTVTDSAVGQLAIVPKEFDGALLNQNTVRLFKKKSTSCNDYFMFLLLQSTSFRKHLDVHSHGTANQASINVEDILNFQFYLPNINIQNDISKFLKYKSHEIEDLIVKESQKIEHLREYRQSLISEVVTGKIDVSQMVEA